MILFKSFNNVDFPQPLTPTSATDCPLNISTDILFKTVCFLFLFLPRCPIFSFKKYDLSSYTVNSLVTFFTEIAISFFTFLAIFIIPPLQNVFEVC